MSFCLFYRENNQNKAIPNICENPRDMPVLCYPQIYEIMYRPSHGDSIKGISDMKSVKQVQNVVRIAVVKREGERKDDTFCCGQRVEKEREMFSMIYITNIIINIF